MAPIETLMSSTLVPYGPRKIAINAPVRLQIARTPQYNLFEFAVKVDLVPHSQQILAWCA